MTTDYFTLQLTVLMFIMFSSYSFKYRNVWLISIYSEQSPVNSIK